MDNVINRGDPIAEQNTNLDGHPASDMYSNWSEDMEDRADNVYGNKEKSPDSAKTRAEKLKEIDEVVKKDLE
ncbi:hypothetical protein [Bacteroides sp.]